MKKIGSPNPNTSNYSQRFLDQFIAKNEKIKHKIVTTIRNEITQCNKTFHNEIKQGNIDLLDKVETTFTKF